MIYAIQETNAKGHIKVGFTEDNLKNRLSSLQVGNPRILSIILLLNGSKKTESAIHAMLQPYHVHGEWFDNRALRILRKRFKDTAIFWGRVAKQKRTDREIEESIRRHITSIIGRDTHV